jgi:hypothetical protein
MQEQYRFLCQGCHLCRDQLGCPPVRWPKYIPGKWSPILPFCDSVWDSAKTNERGRKGMREGEGRWWRLILWYRQDNLWFWWKARRKPTWYGKSEDMTQFGEIGLKHGEEVSEKSAVWQLKWEYLPYSAIPTTTRRIYHRMATQNMWFYVFYVIQNPRQVVFMVHSTYVLVSDRMHDDRYCLVEWFSRRIVHRYIMVNILNPEGSIRTGGLSV